MTPRESADEREERLEDEQAEDRAEARKEARAMKHEESEPTFKAGPAKVVDVDYRKPDAGHRWEPKVEGVAPLKVLEGGWSLEGEDLAAKAWRYTKAAAAK